MLFNETSLVTVNVQEPNKICIFNIKHVLPDFLFAFDSYLQICNLNADQRVCQTVGFMVPAVCECVCVCRCVGLTLAAV